MDERDAENLSSSQAMKAFVGGLAPTTNEVQLKEYFGQFGPLAEVSVMREKTTGRSRGFAFLTYEDIDSLELALESPKHQLDGRTVEVKRAIPRGEVKVKARKVFVGGVPPSSTNESLRAYFEQFGPILEAQIMKDRLRGRSRGFGFVTFEDDESVPKVLAVAEHRLDGKLVDVKKAEPKKPNVPPLGLNQAMAHIHPSPNSSPRGSLAFAQVLTAPYVPYFVPSYMVNTENFSSLGFAGPGYAEAPAPYLFTSPYTSPRGSFTIGESDLPPDFAELSMGPFRRLSADFTGLSIAPGGPVLGSSPSGSSFGPISPHSSFGSNTSFHSANTQGSQASGQTSASGASNTASPPGHSLNFAPPVSGPSDASGPSVGSNRAAAYP